MWKESLDNMQTTFYQTYIHNYSILGENDVFEMVKKMFEFDIEGIAWETGTGPFTFSHHFDERLGTLRVRNDQGARFEIRPGLKGLRVDVNPFKKNSIVELLKFFNQEVTMSSYLKLLTPQTEINFTQVWGRNRAVFHASFSTCHRQHIGVNRDFYVVPTKRFPYTNESNHFDIYFTTDGVNRFLPRHSGFIIELLYIVDSDRVEVVL
jgi:hypothetical protein